MKSNPTLRSILAFLIGAAVGGVLIFAIESVNYVLYPPPQELDLNDPAAMTAYVGTLPLTAFLVVLAAFAVGSFGSAWTAARISAKHELIIGLALGCMFQIGAIYNFIVLPTPTWMWIAGFAVFFPPAYAGVQLALRPAAATSDCAS
jgi:hypothetical protein